MGVKGLHKYINDRHDIYLENFELHDCNVIIDGHSLSCQLYNWRHYGEETRSANCYGGDYDKYAYVVNSFFSMLSQAQVTPYVIFDGGFEEKKLPMILKRMRDKINIGEQLNPALERRQPNKLVFPLFLREVFKDVVINRNIPVAMCQYEGDIEIASMAKLLNCPAITFDSDYYLFGCQYIPFNTIANRARTVRYRPTGVYTYISCKLYKIENLLADYQGLQEETLYLLPVLIGNDYINENDFKPFLKSIGMGNITSQEKIRGLLTWLKRESLETALNKMINHLSTFKDKSSMLASIEIIISGYCQIDTNLLSHFNLSPKVEVKSKLQTFKNLKEKILGQINQREPENNSAHEDKNTEFVGENKKKTISNIFMKNYTKACYPSSFMDILTQNKYYCIPQIEDYNQKTSHICSFELLSVIHKILSNNSDSDFLVLGRDEGKSVKWFTLEKCSLDLPSLEEIENLSPKDRQDTLFKILKLENNTTFLEHVPADWHLFFLALKYSVARVTLPPPFMFALTLSLLTLSCVDQRIRFSRSIQKGSDSFSSSSIPNSVCFKVNNKNVYHFPIMECRFFMETFGRFFSLSPVRRDNFFDKELMHYMAQVQSIFLHIKYINQLLNQPYVNLPIHQIFDSSFIYNVSIAFPNVTSDLDNSGINRNFEKCPSIYGGLKYTLNVINNKIINQN